MFSSKILKIDEHEASRVRTFNLQQFPGDDADDDGSADPKKKLRRTKTTIDAAKISAERVRVKSQQEAKHIIDTAQQQAKQILQDAHAKGYAEGLQAGTQKGEQEFGAGIQQLGVIAGEFDKIKTTFYDDHQDIILELALKIARKVIQREVTADRELVVSVLRSAMKLAVEREKLKIRIHPEDMEVCLQNRPDLLKHIDGVKQMIFEPDDSIGRGGAVIEYAFGEIDARIDRQFAEVEQELSRVQQDLDDMYE